MVEAPNPTGGTGLPCHGTDHTQNNNHLDQNIGIIWHKRSMSVNNNTAEYNVPQGKRNDHETIHDGAVGMTSRFKTSQESCESLISLRQSHPVLISSPLSPSQKCETNSSRDEMNAAVFANRIS